MPEEGGGAGGVGVGVVGLELKERLSINRRCQNKQVTMPEFINCQLEEIDQNGKSIRRDITVTKYTISNTQIILEGWHGVESEIELREIASIEQYGMHGIILKTAAREVLLKSNGDPAGDESLIDLNIKLIESRRKSSGHQPNVDSEQKNEKNSSSIETVELLIGYGDDRHDIYMHEPNGSYIQGIAWGDFGEIILHRHFTSEQTSIKHVYAKENQILKKGDKIIRLAEKTAEGGIRLIDLIYGSAKEICINRIAEKGICVEEETEAVGFFALNDKKAEATDEGSVGVVHMPLLQIDSHPFIQIKWKAETGSIVEKGEAVCIIEVDDGDQSFGEITIDAPYRLCVSSPSRDFDTGTSVFIGGVLLEYLRLPDMPVLTNKKRDTKPRKEKRKAARVSIEIAGDLEYANGIDSRWKRILSLDLEEDTMSAVITKWFCERNSLVRSGDGIARIEETRKNGDIVWRDIYYNGEVPIWIYSTKGEDQDNQSQALHRDSEICSAYLVIAEDAPIPAYGEYGYIRMPFVDGDMQLVSLVKWKAAAGEIYEEGERVCELTILDWESDPIRDCIISAPCRLQVCSNDFNSTRSVYTNGILLEYLRLREVQERPPIQNQETTYRNKGRGRKDEVGSGQVKRETGYRNQGAGIYEVLGVAVNAQKEFQTNPRQTSHKEQSNPQDIQEHIFWTPANGDSFAYGKIVEWKEGNHGSFYKKNDLVCEIICFTPDSRPAFTEYVKAACDMVVTERLATQGQQITNSCPLFRYTPRSSQSSHQQPSPQSDRASSGSKETSQRFSYKTVEDISRCTGKSISEVRNLCQQLGYNEPFSLVYADRIADHLTGNPSIKRAWESSSSDGASMLQSNKASQNNQISEPIEGLDDFIGVVRNYHAFTVRDVLERIVTTERERIENEKGLWRLGAGVAALAFGISIDGFDAGDLLAGWTFSNIGAAAHQLASKEQIEFLKKLQSEWLVLDRSPIDIRRRLGEPQGRFIGISRENRLDMFNIHQSGTRGFHLVELDYAGNIAKGFKDPQSLEVLQRSYSEEDIGLLSSLLYPSTIMPLKLCRTITPEEAKKKDPYYNQLSKAGAPFRVVYSDDTEGVMYKIRIPHHSDY